MSTRGSPMDSAIKDPPAREPADVEREEPVDPKPVLYVHILIRCTGPFALKPTISLRIRDIFGLPTPNMSKSIIVQETGIPYSFSLLENLQEGQDAETCDIFDTEAHACHAMDYDVAQWMRDMGMIGGCEVKKSRNNFGVEQVLDTGDGSGQSVW